MKESGTNEKPNASKLEVAEAVSLTDVAAPLDSGDVIAETVKAFVIGPHDYVGHGTVSRAYSALEKNGSFYVAKDNEFGLCDVVAVYCGEGEDVNGDYRKFKKA